jgi:hypothetical protein
VKGKTASPPTGPPVNGPASLGTLYLEELKALARGRFAWLGAAVVLLAIGGLATVGTQDTWLDGYGIVAYGVVPLAFIPVAAVALASPRANRFVESIFTAPVPRRDWLIAKILVLFTLGAAYCLSLAPMMFVYSHFVGFPFLLRRFLLWTPGIVVASIAIGSLIGVLFIGRSIAAPAATAMGVLLAYGGLVPLQELMIAQGNGASRTGHVTLLSPAVLLKNGLQFTLVAPSVVSTVTWTWVSLVVIVAGALLLTFWTFLRTQGVETWETTRRQRWTLVAAITALVVLPVVAADTNYDTPAPRRTNAPAVRGVFGRSIASLALVPSGRPAPQRCCFGVLNRDASALAANETTHADLLVLLPVDTSQQIHDLHLAVAGEGGLDIVVEPESADLTGDRLEKHAYPGDSGPSAADGHHIVDGWVARVPVALTPTHIWDIGGMRYPLNVTATYRLADDPGSRTFSARAAIDAQVAPAIYQMGAASALLPLACFVAAYRRWRRTR